MKPVSFQFLAAVASSAIVASATAQEPQGVARVLVDRALTERQVQLVGLDGRTIVYADAAGLLRSESVSEYVAVIPPLDSTERPGPVQDQAPASVRSILELTDGQRFFGELAPAAALKDGIRWSHPMLGILEFPLDQVRRIRLAMPAEGSWVKPPPPTAPDQTSDTVVFANGDRVSGFVDEVSGSPPRITIAPADKGEPRRVSLEVVREVVFANAPQTPPAHATLVWLHDGSVIACRSVRTTRLGELSLTPALQETDGTPTEAGAKIVGLLRLDDLVGAAFEPGTLVPLCSIPPAEHKALGDRRWTPPIAVADAQRAVLGAGDIELPGPLSIAWDLPAGVLRLAADAELPRQMRTWGDCELVVVADDGREAFRARLNAEHPQVRVVATLAGARRLTIRVEPGPHGGVQNRVVLHRPILLLQAKP